MPSARRFAPPWIVEEHAESFIVHDATGQTLGYFHFEDEPGRRSADVRFKATAVIGCASSETARSRMPTADIQSVRSDMRFSGI
jgi:hypothetical protein